MALLAFWGSWIFGCHGQPDPNLLTFLLFLFGLVGLGWLLHRLPGRAQASVVLSLAVVCDWIHRAPRVETPEVGQVFALLAVHLWAYGLIAHAAVTLFERGKSAIHVHALS
ncbi:MAG: hypothetical protein RMK02_08060 [Burkholderiales bacterium]|nr:hypothetical protein [Burkholderiales bacterium]